MKQSVSNHSVLPVAAAISMSILWIAFVLPVTGVLAGGLLGLLTLAAALWVGMRSTLSMAQMIHGIDTEPVPVTVPAKSVR